MTAASPAIVVTVTFRPFDFDIRLNISYSRHEESDLLQERFDQRALVGNGLTRSVDGDETFGILLKRSLKRAQERKDGAEVALIFITLFEERLYYIEAFLRRCRKKCFYIVLLLFSSLDEKCLRA